MAYTLNSDNKSRVAEIATVDLNKYGKIENPVSEKSNNLQISEMLTRLALG